MFPMGGVSPVRPATAEIQCICNKMKPQVEMKDGRNFQCFRAIVFTSQVLAGTNYFIKVDVGHDECLHLRIYQDLNGQRLLNSYQSDKTQFCPLTYF